MADVKWSDNTAFPNDGNIQSGDLVVGLRSGANGKFTLNTAASKIASDVTKTTLASIDAPPTSGNVAVFTDNVGTIAGGGVLGQAAFKAVSDNSKSTVPGLTGSFTSGNFASYADTAGTLQDSGLSPSSFGIGSPAQVIYISNDGSSGGDGTIQKPFDTYAAAVAFIGSSASETTPYVILAIGVFNISGDMVFRPFINLQGYGRSKTIFNVGGSVHNNAPVFGTATNPNLSLSGFTLNISGGDFSITNSISYVANTAYYFDNIEISGTLGYINGYGTGFGSGPITTISINNCSFPSDRIKFRNINPTLSNCSIPIGFSIENNLADTFSIAINHSLGVVGESLIDTADTATNNIKMIGNDFNGNNLNVSYTQNVISVDSSWSFVPVYTNGASIFNFALPSLADGSNANFSFSPSAYTPTAGTNYLAASVTGNLSGIDAKLATVGGAGQVNVIYLSQYGSDGNDGTILRPVQTYAAAIALIGASATWEHPYVIKASGIIHFAYGVDMPIYKYISVEGYGWTDTLFDITGGYLTLDSGFTTDPQPQAIISNCRINPGFGSSSLVFASHVQFAQLIFNNILFGGALEFVGSGANSEGEYVSIYNSQFQYATNGYCVFRNISFTMVGTQVSQIDAFNDSITNTVSAVSGIPKNSYNPGSATALNMRNSSSGINRLDVTGVLFTEINMDGTGNQLHIDSGSYTATPGLTGGATLADIYAPSISDGVSANVNFTPSNYTPTADTNYTANSVTGNLKGIDLALASASGGTSPAQAIYVANDGDDMTGNGTIQKPFATYDAAVSFIAASATADTPYVIIMLGVFNIPGDLVFYPFINVLGYGWTQTILNVSGDCYNDPTSFSASTAPTLAINNFSLNVTGVINIIPATFVADTKFSFVNINGTAGNNIVFNGADTTTDFEFVDVINCKFTTTLFIVGMSANVLDCSLPAGFAISSGNTTNSTIDILGLTGITGASSIDSAGSSTLIASLSGIDFNGNTLIINSTANTTYIDSSAWTFEPQFFNGATIAQIIPTSLSDGVNASENFMPTNYTPVGNVNFYSDTAVTAHLAGIDAAIAALPISNKALINTDTFNLAVDTQYIVDNGATLAVCTLPATAPVNSVIKIIGHSDGSYEVLPNAGQTIVQLDQSATVSIEPTNKRTCVELVCTVADTEWTINHIMGNFDFT